jgi:hypothetical protein
LTATEAQKEENHHRSDCLRFPWFLPERLHTEKYDWNPEYRINSDEWVQGGLLRSHWDTKFFRGEEKQGKRVSFAERKSWFTFPGVRRSGKSVFWEFSILPQMSVRICSSEKVQLSGRSRKGNLWNNASWLHMKTLFRWGTKGKSKTSDNQADISVRTRKLSARWLCDWEVQSFGQRRFPLIDDRHQIDDPFSQRRTKMLATFIIPNSIWLFSLVCSRGK